LIISMTKHIRIAHHFLFEKGFFEKHVSLFDVYRRNALHHDRKKARHPEKWPDGYEETVKWPVIRGPGFCGATHPGAGKCFNRIMMGASDPVYNSDCLYVHPGLHVFAVSDPPGATTISRRLFAELDQRLKNDPGHRLETLIHDIAAGIDSNIQPTLALIAFTKSDFSEKPDRAFVFIAGDTEVYHGNLSQNRLTRINGCPHFWGTAYRDFEPLWIDLESDDFFIIASDGISALRQAVSHTPMEDVLLAHVKSDMKNFAFNVMTACNSIYEESFNGNARTLLGGHDDMTILLVRPRELADAQQAEAAILGGHVGG
jgi:hypothetical protein